MCSQHFMQAMPYVVDFYLQKITQVNDMEYQWSAGKCAESPAESQ